MIDDSRERDHRDVGRAAADVDDHVARRLGDRQPGADCRHHRLLDEIDLRRAGFLRRVAHRALLDLGDLARDTDDDPRMDVHLAAVRLLDEVAEHPLGDLEIGDHAVLHRADRLDVAGRAAEHLFRLGADRFDLVGQFVEHDDRRLAHDDAAIPGIDEGIGGAEVDRQVVRKVAEHGTKGHGVLSGQ